MLEPPSVEERLLCRRYQNTDGSSFDNRFLDAGAKFKKDENSEHSTISSQMIDDRDDAFKQEIVSVQSSCRQRRFNAQRKDSQAANTSPSGDEILVSNECTTTENLPEPQNQTYMATDTINEEINIASVQEVAALSLPAHAKTEKAHSGSKIRRGDPMGSLYDQEIFFNAIRHILSLDVAQKMIDSFDKVPLPERLKSYLQRYPVNHPIDSPFPYSVYEPISETETSASSGIFSVRDEESKPGSLTLEKEQRSSKRGRSRCAEDDGSVKQPARKSRKPNASSASLMWRCPFSIAFPEISRSNSRFQSCPSQWKQAHELT